MCWSAAERSGDRLSGLRPTGVDMAALWRLGFIASCGGTPLHRRPFVEEAVVGRIHLRRVARFVTGSIATFGVALAGPASAAPSATAVFHPPGAGSHQKTSSSTPPPPPQIHSAGRRGFTPHA